MNNRTVGIVATVITVLCCACPGLLLCLDSAFLVVVRRSLFSQFGVQGLGGVGHPYLVGLGLGCLSLILIAIPILVGFVTLRNKPSA